MELTITDVSKPIVLREFIWDSISEEKKSKQDLMVLVSRKRASQIVSFFHPCRIVSNLCSLEDVYRILGLELQEVRAGVYHTIDLKEGHFVDAGVTRENLWNWLKRKGYVPQANVPYLKKGDRVLTVLGLGVVVDRDYGCWCVKLDRNPFPSSFEDGILCFFKSEILGKAHCSNEVNRQDSTNELKNKVLSRISQEC